MVFSNEFIHQKTKTKTKKTAWGALSCCFIFSWTEVQFFRIKPYLSYKHWSRKRTNTQFSFVRTTCASPYSSHWAVTVPQRACPRQQLTSDPVFSQENLRWKQIIQKPQLHKTDFFGLPLTNRDHINANLQYTEDGWKGLINLKTQAESQNYEFYQTFMSYAVQM